MSDEQVLKMYEELVQYYDGNVPNPVHYPIQFAHCIKLWKYYKGRTNENSSMQ